MCHGMFFLTKEMSVAGTSVARGFHTRPPTNGRKTYRFLLRPVVLRIVFRVDVLQTKRPNRRHLRDVLAGFSPMEMGRIAGQDDNASWRVRLQLMGVEPIADADVEDAGYNCVHTILRVPV